MKFTNISIISKRLEPFENIFLYENWSFKAFYFLAGPWGGGGGGVAIVLGENSEFSLKRKSHLAAPRLQSVKT